MCAAWQPAAPALHCLPTAFPEVGMAQRLVCAPEPRLQSSALFCGISSQDWSGFCKFPTQVIAAMSESLLLDLFLCWSIPKSLCLLRSVLVLILFTCHASCARIWLQSIHCRLQQPTRHFPMRPWWCTTGSCADSLLHIV
jgi:hypothetical protein